jgi:hypothetical protein
MNAMTSQERQSLDLVDIIDLKWLMAREGHHVHVERLQRDPAYASTCLALAATSPNEATQAAARRLRQCLERMRAEAESSTDGNGQDD